MAIAAAIGMFDGVHRGHQSLVADLRAIAKEEGLDAAVVTFPSHPMQTICPDRAPLLLSDSKQKTAWLIQAGADEVVMLDFNEQLRALSAREFMEMLCRSYGLRLLLMGFNHRFGHDRLSDFADYQRIGAELGIKVVLAQELDSDGHISSSAIRRALEKGEIAPANDMLGRPYEIAGVVAHGQGIGHTIGFPTANIAPDLKQQLIPANGVYAARIAFPREGEEHPRFLPAMVNIGSRPTIADELPATIEANVIGFSGDLYGRQALLQFVARLRDEQKFPSLSALQAQLSADQQSALAIL